MERHPLVAVIRFWFVLAGLLTASLLWPELALGVFPLISNSCCCTATGCGNCTSGTTPTQVQFTLAGTVNSLCANCANFNATFTLDKQASPDCTYAYTLPSPICTETGLTSQLLTHQLYLLLGVLAVQFSKDPGAIYDCSTTYS